MSVYESLAERYETIFPPSKACLGYLRDIALDLTESPSSVLRVVDIGCATGSLLRSLASEGFDCVGLEPSLAMRTRAEAAARALDPAVSRASEKAQKQGAGLIDARLRPRFLDGGMLDAEAIAGRDFDLLLCLGNTLPHLRGYDELEIFLAIGRRMLKPKGHLVLQLLNYASPDIKPGFVFPELRSDSFVFRRSYLAAAEDSALVPDAFKSRLIFHTELFDEATGMVKSDDMPLFPFTLGPILERMEKAGFERPSLRSSWDKAGFDPYSDRYLILSASPRP